jgi:Cu2+-exporting ATPase
MIGRITFRRGDQSLAGSAIRTLRRSPRLAVGLLSGRGESEANALAASLGIDDVGWDLSPVAKAELLRSFRDRGVKVAYVGDCRRDDRAAREAHVAISLVNEFDPGLDPAPIVMLPGEISRVAWLHALSRSHVSRARTVHGATLIPNLVCIAGAFFLGFTSLSSVIVTNLGILGIYSGLPHRARSWRLLCPGRGKS